MNMLLTRNNPKKLELDTALVIFDKKVPFFFHKLVFFKVFLGNTSSKKSFAKILDAALKF